MTPDPSGAARAPQTLLERVKTETLPECELQAGIAAEMGANGDAAVLLRAAEALGALVQAVEDQQRQLETVRKDREALATLCDNNDADVAQLRADGQRLTEALRKYGGHERMCDVGRMIHQPPDTELGESTLVSARLPCNCGWAALAPPRNAP